MSYYETTDRRFVLMRREHIIDSSKDPLADFETINLNILELIKDDSGFYLCIVANSPSSFRVTYGYLNVSELSINNPNTDTKGIDQK